MQQRLPSLLPAPIAFGHRGARGHAVDNTLPSFQLALKLGATGLESDVWLTADGIPVLDHDGAVRIGRRRRPIAGLARGELPEHVATVADLLTTCGTQFHLSLDLKDAAAGPAVIDAVGAADPLMLPQLWLCHPDLDVLVALRPHSADVRLVNSTRLDRLKEGPERRAARLAEAGIDAMNMHRLDWNGGLVTLFHRFERIAFAWDLQFDDHLRTALRMGLDGLFSDFPDRMVDAFLAELGAAPTGL